MASRVTWLLTGEPGAGKLTSMCRPPGCGLTASAAAWAWAIAWTMDRPGQGRPRGRCGLRRAAGKAAEYVEPAAAGTTGPVLVTDRTARESLIAVTTSTWPPGALWRSALSTRLAIRRSTSRESPTVGAGARTASIGEPAGRAPRTRERERPVGQGRDVELLACEPCCPRVSVSSASMIVPAGLRRRAPARAPRGASPHPRRDRPRPPG